MDKFFLRRYTQTNATLLASKARFRYVENLKAVF